MNEPEIVGAEIVAGHDGSAELMVRIRHENGVVAVQVLSEATGLKMIEKAGVGSLNELIGRPWREVIRGVIHV